MTVSPLDLMNDVFRRSLYFMDTFAAQPITLSISRETGYSDTQLTGEGYDLRDALRKEFDEMLFAIFFSIA